ncbi:MAG: OmpA family protein, partial [Pricia sp.]|nr:OmpA family protein [Pricia sp.]
DSIVESSWMIGLGYNFVDDSGDMVDELFSMKSQWNGLSYPSRISIGRYFKSGIGLEAIGTFNKYRIGKIVDGNINQEETNYFGLDARLTYDLNKIIGETAWFDPYLGVGAGYTDANSQPRGTYNAIIGFRTWFSDHLGLDLSSSGKWGIGNNGATNHLQHAAGVVYRFAIEKGLSKKGEEKLAMIEAIENESKRVQDSITAADQAKEQASLAERLAKEKEQSLLAAERERLDAENRRKEQIDAEIKELGLVFFEFNSSYLSKGAKTTLEKLANVLKDRPNIELTVSSHTDSRGTSEYNAWLSERRVERTISYLVGIGIAANRLTPESYGERKLLNECDDNTYCTEDKHQINRRSEFTVLEY